MTHPNLNELAQRIYAQNRAAGWWDNPRPRVQTAWLIVTELAEATEAERAGRYADLDAFEVEYNSNLTLLQDDPGSPHEIDISAYCPAFRKHVKDSFQDEIADAVIRLLDFAASEGVAVENQHSVPISKTATNEGVFFSVCEMVQRYAKGSQAPAMLWFVIGELMGLAELRGFDLWQHVELKLKYNQTRGKMHGGKKF